MKSRQNNKNEPLQPHEIQSRKEEPRSKLKANVGAIKFEKRIGGWLFQVVDLYDWSDLWVRVWEIQDEVGVSISGYKS